MFSEETRKFIKSGIYREVDAELREMADRLFKLTMLDENLPFTEKLMKEYAHNKAKEIFIRSLDNIKNLATDKEIKKVSWK
jgi:hypothetical protein